MFKLLGSLASIAEWFLKLFGVRWFAGRAKNENNRIIKDHDKEAANRKLDDLTGRM